jgi:acid phosphatase family membrane protein YuiD
LKPFVVAFTTAAIVQIYKFFSYWLVNGRPLFGRLFQTGGMPSSHSAAVAALSTAVFLEVGPRHPLFGVTLYLSLIVMYDAAGVRRAAGRQAAILNRMLEEHEDKELRERRLLELLGHTPFEVLVGAAIGVALALAWDAF